MNKVLLTLFIMLLCSVIAPSAKDENIRVGKVSNVNYVFNEESIESDSLLLEVFFNI